MIISRSFITIPLAVLIAWSFAWAAWADTLTVTKSGRGSGTVTSNVGPINCGATCNGNYANSTSITLTATPVAGSQFTGWLGPCSGAATCQFTINGATTAAATFAPLSLGPPSLDIDGNANFDALTDGLMTIRYLFGLSGATLINEAIGPQAMRTTAPAIGDHLIDIRPILDIDGNGQADALTDGLLIIRYLFGLRGPSLIGGAVGSGALYVTAPALEAQIQSLLSIAPPMQSLTVSAIGLGSGTVTSAPAGITCGADCTQNFNIGTAVVLTAAPSADSTFSSWSGACADAGSTCMLTMDAAKSVTASFNLNSTVTPPVDPTVPTSFSMATAFLYTGVDPLQTGVAPGTIDPRRVAVLRGQVRTREGAALAGVTISILAHPEFGQTLTRADGMFDIAVNGGGTLTVNYRKTGFLPVQRKIHTPWRDYAVLREVVVMIPFDTAVTAIDLSVAAMQVARGSPISDADGPRRATVLFPQGTTATMVMPNGSTQPLTTLNIRATEYTVGPTGPNAMPGELPPSSGYTYAVELSADEAVAADAASVQFNQPLPVYVENFVGFPVGSLVPLGSYDRARGQWVAADNGRVIAVLSITSGMADLDLDGDGLVDGASARAALGITDAERLRLGTLYAPGAQLWRALISHFTPWDYNWPYGPPPGAQAPGEDNCGNACPGPSKTEKRPKGGPDKQCGSVIGCETQTLGESVGVTGTSFRLNYQSDHVPGRRASRTLKIRLSGATLPANVQRIRLGIVVAGRAFEKDFSPQPNLIDTFTWDGKDGLGRILQGKQTVKVQIGYEYAFQYYSTREGFVASFTRFGAPANGGPGAVSAVFNNPPGRSGGTVTLWRHYEESVGSFGGIGPVGNWSVNLHHVYDFTARTLYLGNGDQRSADAIGGIITTAVGNGVAALAGEGVAAKDSPMGGPWGVVAGPDGSIYIAEPFYMRVRRVGPDGIVNTFAGSAVLGFDGDGGPATQAKLFYPLGLALGPDGSLYIADSGNNRVRRVAPDGIITTVAGSGVSGFSGDGGPATQAQLIAPQSVAVGPDGSLYIMDQSFVRVRRVGLDGIITTVAGRAGASANSGDGGLATQAGINGAQEIAMGPDGSLYISNSNCSCIRRVGPDGIITTVAGNGNFGSAGDGGPAIQAELAAPAGLAVAPDGVLYIADSSAKRVRQVTTNGIITTVAGSGVQGFSGDNGPANLARMRGPVTITVAPDESLYMADAGNTRIRQRRTPLPNYFGGDIIIAAQDGSEFYVFADTGRHLRTHEALTGALRFQFGYDASGRLATITDGDGNVTSVQRDGNGNPTAIVAPFGQQTTLSVNGDGYLASVTNPAGEAIQLTYKSGVDEGLLATYTDARNNVHNYLYDAVGRLVRDENPAGGVKILARTDLTDARYKVSVTTALGLVTTHEVEEFPNGDTRRLRTDPSGAVNEVLLRADGTRRVTNANGTVAELIEGPDPRFAMQAPILSSIIVTTPGGITTTRTATRTATLSNPNDLLTLTTQTDTTNINGRTYTRLYNVANRTFTFTTPAGRQHQLTLDTKGRSSQASVAGLTAVQVSRDSQGRLDGLNQGARTHNFAYNPQGFLSSLTDPLAHTVSYAYDAAGRATQITRPDTELVQFAYDANGNMVALTPPDGTAHSFTFSPMNLVQSYSPPAIPGGPTGLQFTYDVDGRLTQTVRADTLVTLAYDAAGHMQSVNSPQATDQATYSAASQLTTLATTGGIGLSYTKDGSLPTGTTWTGPVSGTVQRTFDNDRRLTSRTINGANAQSFTYDNDGLLAQAGAMALQRSAQNGLLTGTTLGQVTDARTFSGFGEWNSYSAMAGATPLFSAQYTRDQAGRVTQIVEGIGGVSATYAYAYDLAGRLLEVKKNGVITSASTYDANGNRLTHTIGGVGSNSSFDAQDRLTQSGTTTFVYTKHGELASATTGGQTTSYSNDVQGNLRSVVLPGGTQIAYLIDGRRRRIGKLVNGIKVQGFLYQSRLQPVAELDGNNAVVSTFVYGSRPSVPDYLVKGGVTYRIIADHLGSPRVVVNTATGAIAQQLDYDAFGNVLSDSNPGFQPFGFAGGLYDRDTDLVRFGARDYDPATGRWTSKDASGFAGGMNLYGYANGDPVNYIDQRGKSATLAWGLAAAGGATGIGATVFAATAIAGGVVIAIGILSSASVLDSFEGDATHDDEGLGEGGAPSTPDGGTCPEIPPPAIPDIDRPTIPVPGPQISPHDPSVPTDPFGPTIRPPKDERHTEGPPYPGGPLIPNIPGPPRMPTF